MFNTTFTDELIQSANICGLGVGELAHLTLIGVRASQLAKERRLHMEQQLELEFDHMRSNFHL